MEKINLDEFKRAMVFVHGKYAKACTQNAAFQMFNEGVVKVRPKVNEWFEITSSYGEWALESLFNTVKGGEFIVVIKVDDIKELPNEDQKALEKLMLDVKPEVKFALYLNRFEAEDVLNALIEQKANDAIIKKVTSFINENRW